MVETVSAIAAPRSAAESNRRFDVREQTPGYAEAIGWLFDQLNYERTPASGGTAFRLDRMRALLAALGDPQQSVPCVHVAGTKGKGSTAAMLAAILQSAGYRAGLMTSPHIERVEERFQVNRMLADPSVFVELMTSVRRAAEVVTQTCGHSPTFFELTTAAGWLHFQREQCELAVIEVGLGGRLDATNVCSPLATAVTSISFDHTQLLGNTLELIAAEKAGIAKPGVPMFVGTHGTATDTIRNICAPLGAEVRELGRDIRFDTVDDDASEHAASQAGNERPRLPKTLLTVSTASRVSEAIPMGLAGRHQAANAALAVGIADWLNTSSYPVPEQAVRDGIANVQWPLRCEVVSDNPLLIVDAAHNNASIAALLDTLAALPVRGRKVVLFGTSRDKDAAEMIRLQSGFFDEIVFSHAAENCRAVPAGELAEIAGRTSSLSVHCRPVLDEALELARRLAGGDGLVCATGSFFLAAQVRTGCRTPREAASV